MNKRRTSTWLVVLMVATLGNVPARADSGDWPDRGDGRGALAIRKIEIGHIRDWERASSVTVVFDRPVRPSDLKKDDFFVLDLSGNSRRKSDVWFYFWGGQRNGSPTRTTRARSQSATAVTGSGGFLRDRTA